MLPLAIHIARFELHPHIVFARFVQISLEEQCILCFMQVVISSDRN